MPNREEYFGYDENLEADYCDCHGGVSALCRGTKSNPCSLPSPTCGRPNMLTPKDRQLGYQCDRCADIAERGGGLAMPRVPEQIGQNAGEDLIPRTVLYSILKSYPDQAVEILQDLHYSHTNGCYFCQRWGMYVGVEYDGYIHTFRRL